MPVRAPSDRAPPPRQASWQPAPIARLALGIMALLVVYASLYPFTGWTDVGLPAFAYLRAPWPRYWLGSEIAANVAAYAPLGALFVWAVYPGLRGTAAVLAATLACGALSAMLEALQTFLPDRIASNVDLAANACGALLGSLLAAPAAPRLIGAGASARWRARWFTADAGPALMLAMLWTLVQVPRQPMLFGTGELGRLLGDWVSVPSGLLGEFWPPSPAHRVWAESACTAVAVIGVSMLLLHVARPVRARGVLPFALVAIALAIKTLLQPLAVPGLPAGVWATGGALLGGAAGMLLAAAFAYLPPPAQRVLGIVALALQLAIVNLFPPDQYFDSDSLFAGVRWLRLESLTLGLSVIWPLAALLLLLVRHRAARS
ncbi:VanZ family protein [Pigmentiphaga soli]|uniref:VanZ family protein n=1 Tax=Pigmentiphaga soli TaxID=1007095 RepID=A0ABP8HBZ5_9BURK